MSGCLGPEGREKQSSASFHQHTRPTIYLHKRNCFYRVLRKYLFERANFSPDCAHLERNVYISSSPDLGLTCVSNDRLQCYYIYDSNEAYRFGEFSEGYIFCGGIFRHKYTPKFAKTAVGNNIFGYYNFNSPELFFYFFRIIILMSHM